MTRKRTNAAGPPGSTTLLPTSMIIIQNVLLMWRVYADFPKSV